LLELQVSSRLYQAIVRVAGFERHDDSNDSLYLMDDDKSKPIFGSFIVKNSDMPKLQKGIIVNAERREKKLERKRKERKKGKPEAR